jgi:choline dehydrogenase-like flavoprotein
VVFIFYVYFYDFSRPPHDRDKTAPGWSYKDVLPHFIKSEALAPSESGDPQCITEADVHGTQKSDMYISTGKLDRQAERPTDIQTDRQTNKNLL